MVSWCGGSSVSPASGMLAHRLVVADQLAQAAEIFGAEQLAHRHIHLRRVGNEGVAVAIRQARRLDMAVHAHGAQRAVRAPSSIPPSMPRIISATMPWPFGGHS